MLSQEIRTGDAMGVGAGSAVPLGTFRETFRKFIRSQTSAGAGTTSAVGGGHK